MKGLITMAAALVAALSAHAGLTLSGGSYDILTQKPEANSGLECIYIANGMEGVTATYTANDAQAPVVWYRYSSMGGGYAEEITGTEHAGTQWTLARLEGNMGYIIEEGTHRLCFWVVDYSTQPFSIGSVSMAAGGDCDMSELTTSGEGAKIMYYGINGRPLELSREIEVKYTQLEYNEDSHSYVPRSVTDLLGYLPATIHVHAPLCDTRYTVTGDRFLRAWGCEMSASTNMVSPTAVACETVATQQTTPADNEQSTGVEGLGGSAPALIDFSAAVTDAVVFAEWQMSRSAEFEDIDLRLSGLDCSYTFTERGTTYVRFVCANASGTCEAYGTTYEVYIGDSALQCPNAFSPGGSEGVNDIWKVSYKSLISFECHIFNKWGTKMCSFTDPADGWDGRYGGKIVPAGVYYYVIKAVGADGKKYNLSGDINIINYK